MLSVATPPRARADSFVEFEGFRYRLNVVPEYTGVEGHMPVSATLVEAVSYEDAIMGVKLPDFVYADGVQYPVTGIESTAYTGYYGIKSVGYNKFCGPRPYWESSEGSYLSEVYVVDNFYGSPGQFDGWTALRTLTVDYASQYRPTNIHVGTFDGNYRYPDNISLSAFTDSYDFTLSGYLDPMLRGTATLRANLGFNMQHASFMWEDKGDYNPSLIIKCAAPVPPEVGIDPRFFSEDGSVELHVPVGTLEAYKEAEGWDQFGDNIYADIDFAYNHVDDYVETNGLYYGIDYDEQSGQPYAYVIGPVDRECEDVEVMDRIDWNYQSLPVKKIGPCAFMNCKNIHSFSLPDGLEVIGDMAFYGCWGTSYNDDYYSSPIYLPSSVIEIGKKAFDGACVNQRMPESLKKVDDGAFESVFTYDFQHNRPDYLILNEGLEYIGDRAFFSYNNALSMKTLVVPSSVTHIGVEAFGDRNLEELEFRGDSFENFGYDVVLCANNKSEVTLPTSIEVIQECAVMANKVIVGENVRKIMPAGLSATELWMLPDTPPEIYEQSIADKRDIKDITIHVKPNCKDAYASHPVWGKVGSIIDDIDWVEVEQGDWKFKVDRYYNTAELIGYSGDQSVEKLVFPSEVTLDGQVYPVETLGKWAVSDLSYGAEIEIPASVNRVRNYAVTNSWLGKVTCKSTVPPTVDMKYPYAFQWPAMYEHYTTLLVPVGTVDDYKASDFGKMFTSIEEDTRSGIDAVSEGADYNEALPVEIYSVGGMLMYDGLMSGANLPAGIYIMKQGEFVGKHIVR